RVVNINVMHAEGVPAFSTGRQHRTFSYFLLLIGRRCQLRDMESSHLLAIGGIAILSKPDEAAIPGYYPSRRTGYALVAGDNRAERMLRPFSCRAIGIVEG